MIAGETDYIIHGGEDNYDYFLKNLLSKNQDPEVTTKRAARKEKRQQWWGKQKENFQNAGGMEGITSTIGNIVGYFKDDTPYDYDISVGGQPAVEPEKKGVSKEVMIIGGIAILVIAAYGLSVLQKNKKIQRQSA